MKPRHLFLALLMLSLTGCDFFQKKPETARPADISAHASAHAPAAAPWADDDGGQQRSLRLMGPGVSQERQTKL